MSSLVAFWRAPSRHPEIIPQLKPRYIRQLAYSNHRELAPRRAVSSETDSVSREARVIYLLGLSTYEPRARRSNPAQLASHLRFQ
jgi:hypothetical protein